MKVLGIIPARYNSRRLPGKPLLDLGGKTMINRVYTSTLKSKLDDVIVATDDVKIHEEVKSFGGKVIMTNDKHHNGTERCYEALQKISVFYDFIINIQGDLPFINPKQINKLIENLNKKTQIITLAKKIYNLDEIDNKNIVKVSFNANLDAVNFKRKIINKSNDIYKHIGIYGFRRDILKKITQLKKSKLEISSGLEQIRWIENNFKIKVITTKEDEFSIDTIEDVKKIKRQYKTHF